MSLVVDQLSILEIAWRWSARSSSIFPVVMPVRVCDFSRTLLHAILHGELNCLTLNLDKYHGDDPDEAKFHIRYHTDEIYRALGGGRISRKLLRHAIIERREFFDWCTRRTIPLPEFWFPPGWAIDYPWDEVHAERDRLTQARRTYSEQRKQLNDRDDLTTDQLFAELERISYEFELATGEKPDEAMAKLTEPQRAKIATQVVALQVWKDLPTTNITDMARNELVRKYGGSATYSHDTLMDWLREVAPDGIKGKRGRPPKDKNSGASRSANRPEPLSHKAEK